ncbi:major facilitator superfamily domain-containing protein [Chlamydoabsidia padenii]|nr:major facilitator superfamily domain-containing protein [Chlamydoabsidia padenii]
MVLRPTVAPITSTPKRCNKRPMLLNLRSCKTFIFWTAAVGLFTSTFVHSILFPLSPFIVNRIKHNHVGASGEDDPMSYHHATALASDSEATSRETGILVALYAVGLLGDKIKQRRVPMLMGILASMSANYVFMFASAYWMLLLARFLQGVSNACVWTMSLCLIADNWPMEELGCQMGKLVGFYPLGLVVGLPTGGILYSNLGYQSPFIASAILCGVDFLMRLVIIEPCHSPPEWFLPPGDDEAGKDDKEKKTESIREEEVHDTTPVVRVTTLQLLRHPRLIVSLLLTAIVATVMSAFEPTLSMRFAAEWNFDAADCGLILIAFMVPSVISSGFCGWLCDKYGGKIVAIVSLVLTIPSGIMMGVPNHQNTSFWVFIPILALCGITMAGCQAPVFPEIARVVALENKSEGKDGLAKSYALFNAAYGTGMCVGPIVAGFLYTTVGFFWLCCLLSTCFVFCIPLVYLYIGGSRQWIVRPPQ